MGKMLRAALNPLAAAAPDWLAQHPEHGWVDRYAGAVKAIKNPRRKRWGISFHRTYAASGGECHLKGLERFQRTLNRLGDSQFRIGFPDYGRSGAARII